MDSSTLIRVLDRLEVQRIPIEEMASMRVACPEAYAFIERFKGAESVLDGMYRYEQDYKQAQLQLQMQIAQQQFMQQTETKRGLLKKLGF